MSLTTEQYTELKARINTEVSRRSVATSSNPSQGTPAPSADQLVRQRSINTTGVALEMTDASIQPEKNAYVKAHEGDNILGKLSKINEVLDVAYNNPKFEKGKPIPAAFNYAVLSKYLDDLGAKPAETEQLNTGCNGACVGLCVSSCYSLCTGYFTFNVNFFSDFFSSFGGDFGGDSLNKVATNPKPETFDNQHKGDRFVNFNNFGSNDTVTQEFHASNNSGFSGSDFSVAFSSNKSASFDTFTSAFETNFSSGFSSEGTGGFGGNDIGEPKITDDFVTDFTTNVFFNVFSGDSINAFSGDFQSDFVGSFTGDFSNDGTAHSETLPPTFGASDAQFSGDFKNAFSANEAFSDNFTGDFSDNFGGDFNANANAQWQGPGTSFSGDFGENFGSNTAYGFGDFAGNTTVGFIGNFSSFNNEVFLGNSIKNDDPSQFSADSFEDHGGQRFSTNFSGNFGSNFTSNFTFNFSFDFFSSFSGDFSGQFSTDFGMNGGNLGNLRDPTFSADGFGVNFNGNNFGFTTNSAFTGNFSSTFSTSFITNNNRS